MNSTPLPRLRPLMLGGTGSDVGKSVIAAGLCRIFRQDGYSPAPFKAQNMALNSYATPDGLEIGRAQAVQAEAAGIPCCTDMNPLLLKPSGQHTSQVVLDGRPIGNRDAYTYFRRDGRGYLRRKVCEAFDRLASRHNPIVMEGAGSIAEINLRDSDLVNMPMARHAGAAVVLVADIDRGGVFASVYGSIMLQTPEDRAMIKGVIINKFRGDMRLFDEGRKMMERICGVPVLGVVPWAPHIHIDEEDSVALDTRARRSDWEPGKPVRIAVVRLPFTSNYTDFGVLERHPLVSLLYTSSATRLKEADAVILPGSKNTIADLEWLRNEGLDRLLHRLASEGKCITGICGGYQMLGLTVADPHGVEGEPRTVEGLGLLPVHTELGTEKVSRAITFEYASAECKGYEIHMGTTVRADGGKADLFEHAEPDVTGTYIHGFLDNRATVDALLSRFVPSGALPHFDPAAEREAQFDALASLLRENIDMERLYRILTI